MSIFYLNGSNDLATVPISAIYIRLLVKQLFSFAKIQQFVGYTKKSIFLTIGVGKGFSRAFKRLSISFQKALKEPFKACSFLVLPCLVHAKKMYKYAKGKVEMNKYPKTRL